jgi:hypothetical protein
MIASGSMAVPVSDLPAGTVTFLFTEIAGSLALGASSISAPRRIAGRRGPDSNRGVER